MNIKNFSFTYNCVLKAQTPLIHFQHDQSNATLRATEVKPKLDRFIQKKIGKDNLPAEWKRPEHENALNYKLQLTRRKPVRIVELGYKTPYDIFYGNRGNDLKKGILADCILSITCFIPELLNFIKENLTEFFVITNFGTMQGKGFGSFITEEGLTLSSQEIAEYLKNNCDAEHCYYFTTNNTDFVFKQIKTIYTVMKSGIGHGKTHPSLLFEYISKKFGWNNEKQIVRKAINSRKPSEDTGYYVRALLGVCALLDFKRDHIKVTISHTVKDKEDKIERLPSPIFFKVINNNVYIVAQRIDGIIYGKNFRFYDKTHKKPITTLTVPTKDELTETFIDDFLAYSINELKKYDATKQLTIKEV